MGNNEKILIEQETAAGDGYASMHAQATAEKFKALTSLRLLMQHPAGIGDHSTADYHKNLDEACWVRFIRRGSRPCDWLRWFNILSGSNNSSFA
jgi:hypothetical protein